MEASVGKQEPYDWQTQAESYGYKKNSDEDWRTQLGGTGSGPFVAGGTGSGPFAGEVSQQPYVPPEPSAPSDLPAIDTSWHKYIGGTGSCPFTGSDAPSAAPAPPAYVPPPS